MLVLSLPFYTVHALKLHTILEVYIKDFKKGYQARVNMIKNENEELLADSNSILNRWKDYRIYTNILHIFFPEFSKEKLGCVHYLKQHWYCSASKQMIPSRIK